VKTFQESMDEVKVESYKDCVWYLEDTDKCKMCNGHGVNLPCNGKENMNEFCVWVTKFFKSSSNEEAVVERDESISKAYLSFDKAEEVEKKQSSLFQTIMDALK